MWKRTWVQVRAAELPASGLRDSKPRVTVCEADCICTSPFPLPDHSVDKPFASTRFVAGSLEGCMQAVPSHGRPGAGLVGVRKLPGTSLLRMAQDNSVQERPHFSMSFNQNNA